MNKNLSNDLFSNLIFYLSQREETVGFDATKNK